MTPGRRSPEPLQWVITALLAVVIALLGMGAASVNSSLAYLTKSVAAMESDQAAIRQALSDDKEWKQAIEVRLARLEGTPPAAHGAQP